MEISQQNQDVQGDLYEYMLGHMQFAGRGGQFRRQRHIIRMMVQVIDPKPRERIGDLAGMVARVEALRGRMSEAQRQVEGLLAEAFSN